MSKPLSKLEIGGGQVHATPGGWELALPAIPTGYADAQLDNTQGRRRTDFLHRPPAHLSLEARTAGDPTVGTLGFGFWNDPFPSFGGAAGSTRFLPAAPQALWFFRRWHPSDLPFAGGAHGTGWCAATLRAPALPGLAVAGLGAAMVAAMLLPPLRPPVVRSFYRHLGSAQQDLEEDLRAWQRYEIIWEEDRAEFCVGGVSVLNAPSPPSGPLGLVFWIDNQWATFSIRHGLRFGVSPCDHPTSLEIRDLQLNGHPIQGPPAYT